MLIDFFLLAALAITVSSFLVISSKRVMEICSQSNSKEP